MNEAAPPTDPIAPVASSASDGGPAVPEPRPALRKRLETMLLAAAVLLAVASLALAWRADQRLRSVEQELVHRQQESAGQSAEARLLARQAQDAARDAAAKVALLDGRVAEVAMQRTQLEDLMQSLSRSRDENLLVDLEAAIRVAVQQAAITGSAVPLVETLQQADERLARYNQPRLEGVRRAIARDLERVKAAGVADVSTLAIKLDEAIRAVDELPLLSAAMPARGAAARGSAKAPHAAGAAGGAGVASWPWDINDAIARFFGRVWDEVRSLVRVTRIDHPDAVLMAPDQAFFLKENLKLRLLNARLALLSRQFDTAQHDLQLALAALDRYFDRSARRTAGVADLLRQVASQARQGVLPGPDDTFAALAAAGVGR